ncbi:MAG: hypothetical protein SWK76_03740 [Actinomycetota bacterium]|nr:hypothetical protein [Actinomycetota bacterium]
MVTKDGTEISSDYVICNVNPVITCVDLIGRQHFPSWYLKRLGWGNIGTSIFSAFLGLDCTSSELRLYNREIAFNLSYDYERHFEAARRSLEVDSDGVGISPYNVLDPEF